MEKKTYEVGGFGFELKPCTIKNRREVINHEMSSLESIMEKVQELDDINDIYDIRDRELWERFVLVTVGPHTQVDPEDADIRIVEEAIDDFFPGYIRTTRGRLESSAS